MRKPHFLGCQLEPRSGRSAMFCVLLMLLVGGSLSGVAFAGRAGTNTPAHNANLPDAQATFPGSSGIQSVSLSEPAEEVTVFAAAGIGHVIQELIGLYQTEAGQGILFRTNFAAASLLARQIENGAHANIYLSANQQWFDYLEERGMIEGGSGYLLATNALILVGAPLLVGAPQGAEQIERLENLPARLARGNYLAMGDIQHVPVGMYGKEALDYYGLWQAVRGRVAQYPNVRSVTNAVATGQADFGIVYRSELLVAPGVRHLWTFEPATYPPIKFMIGALRGKNTPATRDFLRFLKTSRATAVIRKHGFDPQ